MKNATNSTSSHTAIIGRGADGCSLFFVGDRSRVQLHFKTETTAGDRSRSLCFTIAYYYKIQYLPIIGRNDNLGRGTQRLVRNGGNNNNIYKYYDLYFHAEHKQPEKVSIEDSAPVDQLWSTVGTREYE